MTFYGRIWIRKIDQIRIRPNWFGSDRIRNTDQLENNAISTDIGDHKVAEMQCSVNFFQEQPCRPLTSNNHHSFAREYKLGSTGTQ